MRETSIFAHSDCGPYFGSGADLYIADKSFNTNCVAKFPHSFNNEKYQNNQGSYTAFSGAKNGCEFKIKEWEVF